MKFEIRPREHFWADHSYKIVKSGKGWHIERPCDAISKNIPDLELLLDKFFKKRKKWE